MDEKSLNSLKVAFDASPSAALAYVIVRALVDSDSDDGLHDYISYFDEDIDSSLLQATCYALAKQQNKADLKMLFAKVRNPGQHESVSTLIDQMIANSEISEARCLYQTMLSFDRDFHSPRLDKILELDKAPDQSKQSKPKLHVVEKVDFAKVTDLQRYTQTTCNFEDVVGLENIKKQITKKIILPFQKPSLFKRFKKRVGGGVMLYGPPGCGKTLLARAAAGECKATFYNVEISDVLDMYIGESEQKLHAVFERARAQTPSVLFFDEMEALAGKREHTRNSASANVVSQFLTELDGFSQNNQGVLILASTNVPWAIDPAFLRPGRFDRMFFVPPPDRVARKAILQHHMKDRPSKNNIDFASLAAKTSGFSGADLANLVEMAADEAIDDTIACGQDVEIEEAHFREALDDTRPTTTQWLTTARNYARYANDGGRYDDVIDFLKKHGK